MSKYQLAHAAPSCAPKSCNLAWPMTTLAVRKSLILSITLAAASAAPLALAEPPETEPASTQQGVVALPATTVKGQVEQDQSYSGGQVATRNRVGLLGEKDFMDTPFNTISYTGKYIQDLQARDLTDVISATDPSVYSNGQAGSINEHYYIRGFASSIGDVSFGGLYGISPFYRVSPEMYERIDVLKGPSAMLNGMPPGGSVGGSINLVPKRAGDEPLVRLTSTYQSNAQTGGHIDVGRRFGQDNQFGVRVNGVYRDGEGAIKQQKQRNKLASIALDWRGQRANLSLDLYSSDDLTRGQTRGISLNPGISIPKPPKANTLLNPDWAYAETKDKGAVARAEFEINDQLMAYATYGASKTDYKQNGAMFAQVFNEAGDYRSIIGQLAFEVKKQSGEAGFKGKFATGWVNHQWAFNATHYAHEQNDYGRRSVPGADWITNIYHPHWGSAPDFVAPHIAKSKLRLASYGLADTLSMLDERLQVTVGIRKQQVIHDTYSVNTGARTARYNESATTPAVAILVKATDQVAFYANYIEGLSQGATAPATANNSGEIFRPYKSKQNELGMKLDLGSFSHTFSVFEITRPSSYTDPATNIFSFGGEQRNRGVEWGFFGSPVQDIRLMGGVAYVDPKLTKTAAGVNQGKMATGVPKMQGKLGLEWDVPATQGLTLTANATAIAKQYIDAENKMSLSGRTIYDVGARYSTAVSQQPVTLRANVHNLTNKAYWSMPQLTSMALGAPRTFTFSATVDF